MVGRCQERLIAGSFPGVAKGLTTYHDGLTPDGTPIDDTTLLTEFEKARTSAPFFLSTDEGAQILRRVALNTGMQSFFVTFSSAGSGTAIENYVWTQHIETVHRWAKAKCKEAGWKSYSIREDHPAASQPTDCILSDDFTVSDDEERRQAT